LNDGITPPPFSTCSFTWANPGWSLSRSGPTWPLAPAALSTWHPPQPDCLKTVSPATAFAPAGIVDGAA
jgi:hypothetical protein